jgi:hypothetical protein
MREEWRPVVGYEDSYEVSNFGEVMGIDRWVPSIHGERFKKGVVKNKKTDKDGYFRVYLSKSSKKKQYMVHRIVAQAFIENSINHPVVNHIDGNKQNNTEENLEWCTRSHNDLHAFRLGLRVPTDGGTSKAVYKLDKETMAILGKYPSLTEAGRQTGLTTQAISMAVTGKTKQSGGYKWALVDEGVTTIRKE